MANVFLSRAGMLATPPATDGALEGITRMTILELAEKIIQLTGSKSNIVFKPLPQDDPLQRRPDITLAQRQLGWKPTTELDEGLQRTVAYFKELIARENG